MIDCHRIIEADTLWDLSLCHHLTHLNIVLNLHGTRVPCWSRAAKFLLNLAGGPSRLSTLELGYFLTTTENDRAHPMTIVYAEELDVLAPALELDSFRDLRRVSFVVQLTLVHYSDLAPQEPPVTQAEAEDAVRLKLPKVYDRGITDVLYRCLPFPRDRPPATCECAPSVTLPAGALG